MTKEERMREHRRNYKLRHPERVKASKEAWRKRNMDRWVEYNRRWREANPDEAEATRARWIANNPEGYRNKIGLANSRRKARLRAVPHEPYNRLEVLECHESICCICLDLIDPALPPRHKLSFTIQHLVPLSLGGGDVLENVAPAHYSCNSALGNRVVMA